MSRSTLTPRLKLEKVLLLYGSGANGKSVFFEIILALLGKDNVTTFSLDNLTDDKGYSRAMFERALLNYSSEIRGRMITSTFKQLVSGEPVEARLPYGRPYSISHYGKLMFNCNELPQDTELTHAFFRRFLIIPFDVIIAEESQDKHLAQKIIGSELAGVFNWVLQGLERLLENQRFSKSQIMDDVISKFRRDADSVLLFLDESEYEPSTDEHTSLAIVHTEYIQYCQQCKYFALGRVKFNSRLKAIGIQSSRGSLGMLVGLKKMF